MGLSTKAKVQDDRQHVDAMEIQSNLAQRENRPIGRPMNPGVPGSKGARDSGRQPGLGQRKSRKSQVH